MFSCPYEGKVFLQDDMKIIVLTDLEFSGYQFELYKYNEGSGQFVFEIKKNFDFVSHHSMTKDGRFIVFRTYGQLEILGGMQEGELNIVQQISSFWTPTYIFSGNSKFLQAVDLPLSHFMVNHY